MTASPTPTLETIKKVYKNAPCPDCGNHEATYTTSHTPGEPGLYYCIDCPVCEYYEYNYEGPDY